MLLIHENGHLLNFNISLKLINSVHRLEFFYHGKISQSAKSTVHIRQYNHLHVHVLIYMYMYIHVLNNTYTCTYMYMYSTIHIHIHVHVHSCMYIHVLHNTYTCTFMYLTNFNSSTVYSVFIYFNRVVFKFKNSKKANNGTDVGSGQIPELLYR